MVLVELVGGGHDDQLRPYVGQARVEVPVLPRGREIGANVSDSSIAGIDKTGDPNQSLGLQRVKRRSVEPLGHGTAPANEDAERPRGGTPLPFPLLLLATRMVGPRLRSARLGRCAPSQRSDEGGAGLAHW